MNVVGIIQARMGSTRLPGKTLAGIEGRPMLEWMLMRVQQSSSLDKLIVATTDHPSDDRLESWLENNTSIECFRGSENNLVSRFYHCAQHAKADVIVRLTADDPLKDAEIIDHAVKLFLMHDDVDYCSNCLEPTYPEGLDVEVFSIQALQKTYNEARLASETEHLTPFMTNNPEKFHTLNFECNEDLSSWRWTVDKPEDLTFMKKIFAQFKNEPLAGYRQIVDFIKSNPDLLKINAGTVRFEGYLNSVKLESKPC